MERTARKGVLLDLVALSVCLLGFIGLIGAVYALKTGTQEIPRLGLLAFLAMICAPFYVALVRTPKWPYLIPPLVAIFLLYPIASPHGIVYTPDPVFNFHFTNRILTTGFWAPGTGSAFDRTYSFYPLGNVFLGYIILAGQLPAAEAFMWIEPLVRLLALPAVVYSIGQRIFGPRIAVLGLGLYLGTASILFNLPVQQGMGVIFVGLSLLALLILTQVVGAPSRRSVQILFAFASGGIIMTHHLSSYIFAGWLAAVVVLLARRRFRPAVAPLRLGALSLYYVSLLGLYILFFTYQIFLIQQGTLEGAITALISPDESPVGPQSPTPGRTFSFFEIGWLVASVFVMLILALATIDRYRIARRHSFAVANGLVASALAFATLPLIVTNLSYIPLRIGEYTNLVLAPFAAATLIKWTRSGLTSRERPDRRPWLQRKWVVPAAALFISAAVIMGGNLAPLTFRMYFEAPPLRSTDSPLFAGDDAIRAADWATQHFGSTRIWGDQLAVNTFAGFSDMYVDFGSRRVFETPAMNSEVWSRLAVGDYIGVDRWMELQPTNYYHESFILTPLTPAQAEKFATDPHLALVYQDATFTIYRVMSVP